jgi:hypothetical protein
MSFEVYELPRAKADKREILTWLIARSPQGAKAWLDAYDQLIAEVELCVDSFGEAPENEACPDVDVKQAFFKTRWGRTYRMFFIDEDEVYVLRVRGPGQAPVDPEGLSLP